MVSFIALVVLLFLLAAAAMVSDAQQQQQLPLANLSNLDEESVELYYCGADLVEALESSSIPLEKDRLLTIQEPHVKTTGVVDNIHLPVSVQDIRHIQKWNGGAPPPPIRRRLAQVNAPPHSHSEPHFNNNNNEEDEDNDGGDDGPSINSLEEDTDIDIEPIPFSVSKAETGGGGIDNTTIIIVVVSTSTVTFLLATLLFCWYTRTYGGGQNDEKPLLSLSRSASHKSSSSIKDSGDKSYSDPHKTYSSANSSVSLAFTSEPPTGSLSASGIPPLKPPPGRAESTLKPPPGRAESTLKPPPANTISTPPRSPAAAPPPAPSLPPPPLRAPSTKRPPPPPPPSKGAPPPPPPMKEGPRPPPPPGGGRAPPRPPGGGGFKTHRHAFGPGEADADDSNKAKLKPFFWDKVMATPDQAMVWHQIRAGSFQFNEEMIENLFGYNAAEKNKGNNKKSSTSQESSSHFVQIIDSKKAQNLSILLKALNVTTNEVCDALKEGNELPVELIQTLLKMAPTGEEELKLRLYNGDISRLGTAERFLKRLVEIPFAFKRLESLLFMCTLQDEEEIIKESFQTLEAACVQLKKSRLFLKLLEAVLKTGNRMNDGTFRGSAQAFKLDTLLKLSDVKGVDGKTTLVHFVVLEIIRAEGVRAAKTAHKSSSSFKTDDLVEEEATADSCQGDKDEYYRTLGLEVVSRLSNELEDVKKAAILDAEGLSGTVSKFGLALVKAREFLNTELKSLEKEDEDEDNDDEDEFSTTLSNFVQNAEKDVMWMLEEEKRIMALVKNTADYFHGQAGKDEGLRLFIIVRDFLIILDKVCKEVKATPLRPPPKTTPTKDVSSTKTKDVSSSKTLETNDDDVSSPRTTHRTQEADETPKTRSLEAGDSPHKIWETEGSQHETQEAQDLQHETQEVDDLQETKSLDKIQKTDVWQHETHDSNYLPHEIQERKSPYETQQEDDDNLEPKTHEDDLRHETVEPDDSQSKMQEDDDDDLEPTTHDDDLEPTAHEDDDDDDLEPTSHEDDDDDDLEPTSHEDDDDDLEPTSHEDDLGHETLEPDDSQFKMQEDDDDLEPKTHEDDSRHETLEHDGSQSTMQEDDVSQPKTWETDEMHKTDYLPQEIDDSGTKAEDSQLLPAIAIRRVDSSNSSSDHY